jgi:hypothetical protein
VRAKLLLIWVPAKRIRTTKLHPEAITLHNANVRQLVDVVHRFKPLDYLHRPRPTLDNPGSGVADEREITRNA